jgi:hypothetical protein
VGYSNSIGGVRDCYATGTVSATDAGSGGNNAGGVVGKVDDNDNSVSTCYATGAVSATGGSVTNVAGGIVSVNNGKVTNCVALNESISASGTGSATGLIVGDNSHTAGGDSGYARNDLPSSSCSGSDRFDGTHQMDPAVTEINLDWWSSNAGFNGGGDIKWQWLDGRPHLLWE